MRSRKRSSVRLLFAAFAIAPAWSLSACSEQDPPAETGSAEDCRLIANRCHYYDRDGGTALAHDCHETGHDMVSLAQCTAMKASCLAECPERDGGETGGSGGTGNDAASDAGGTGGTGPGGTAGADAGDDSSPDAAGASGSGGAAGSTGTGGSAGSGGSGGHGGATGTACDQLGSICHGVPGDFPTHCHNLGHDLNEPACEAELAACLAACRDAGS
jgi:hypothetical protein